MKMKISVLGAGYVGLNLAAVLADLGHQVFVVRKDVQKTEELKKGKIHFFEPGLEKLVKKNLEADRLIPTTNYADAIPHSEIIFITVGTPSLPHGEADLSHIFSAAEDIGKNLKKGYTLVVAKSTIPPGTTQKIALVIAKNKKSGANFEIAFCPEFLREGSAVEDTFHPDRVVIGSDSPKAIKILKELHRPFNAPTLVTSIASAELIKYAANNYLAARIVFANQIADLCERIGGDVQEVIKGIGLDKRIGNHYWYPGLGYGGSCFPKDVAALAHFADQQGFKENLFERLDQLNKKRADEILNQIEDKLGSFSNKKIGVLGLACKKGTDDIRSAPAIKMVKHLLAKGAKVKAYDSLAMENAKKEVEGLSFGLDPYQAVNGVDALLVLTDCLDFEKLDFKKVKKLMKGKFIFDSYNILPKEKIISLGFDYHSIGKK